MLLILDAQIFIMSLTMHYMSPHLKLLFLFVSLFQLFSSVLANESLPLARIAQLTEITVRAGAVIGTDPSVQVAVVIVFAAR